MSFKVNPYDDDDYLSVIHGDSNNHRFKLDLSNGIVYEGRNHIIGFLDKKEYKQLKRDRKLQLIVVVA